jgi:fluoroquinolone resistance protein
MEFYNQLFTPAYDTVENWNQHEFEKCTFRNLDFSGTSLRGASLTNCRFEACTLQGASFESAKLDDVYFDRSDVSLINFGQCSAFGFHVDFLECKLDSCSFFNQNLKKTRFVDCSLREAKFLKCDLTGAVFKNCNLELTLFASTSLVQADFSTAYNVSLDPDANTLKKTRFSLHSLPGLLTKYDILVS